MPDFFFFLLQAAAVKEIDKALFERNELHLIDGQPSKPIRKQGGPLIKDFCFQTESKCVVARTWRRQREGRNIHTIRLFQHNEEAFTFR